MALHVTYAELHNVHDIYHLIDMHGVHTLNTLYLEQATTIQRVIAAAAPSLRAVVVNMLHIPMLAAAKCAAIEALTVHIDRHPSVAQVHLIANAQRLTALTLRFKTLHDDKVRRAVAQLPSMLPLLTSLSIHMHCCFQFEFVPALGAVTHFTFECTNETQLCNAAKAAASATALQYVRFIMHADMSAATAQLLNDAVLPAVHLDVAALSISANIRAQVICVRKISGVSLCENATIRTDATVGGAHIPAGTRLEQYCLVVYQRSAVFFTPELNALKCAGTVVAGAAVIDVLNIYGCSDPITDMHVFGPHMRQLSLFGDVPHALLQYAVAQCTNLTHLHVDTVLHQCAVPATIEHITFRTTDYDALLTNLPRWPRLASITVVAYMPVAVEPLLVSPFSHFMRSVSFHPLALPAVLATLDQNDMFFNYNAANLALFTSVNHSLRARLLQPVLRQALWTPAAHSAMVHPLVSTFVLAMQRTTECSADLLLQLLERANIYSLAGV